MQRRHDGISGCPSALLVCACAIVCAAGPATAGQEETGWVELLAGTDLGAWREPHGEWFVAGGVSLKEGDPTKFAWTPGAGTLINGAGGRTCNLLTVLEHGDCEAHVEFVVPKGSNSGVYFMGRYEIQVLDSWDDEAGRPKENPQHGDCGGIYQRWIDGRGFEGRPPRINACRAYGEWQSFDVTFLAPRFSAQGKKIANARFVRVVHNGVVVHENQEVTGPTRAATYQDEKPAGPIMLQGDHGPVAYRALRIRPLELVPEEVYGAIARYEPGQSRKELVRLEEALRVLPPVDFPKIEQRLLAILAAGEASVAGKRFVCRVLRRIGSAACVRPLAALLADEKLAHMARFALQHLPCAEVDAALRDALAKLTGSLRIGVVGSIGERGDPAAVPALAALLGKDDVALAAAAVRALGRIGGAEAARALEEARLPRELRYAQADARLACAERLVREGKEAAAAAIYRSLTGKTHEITVRLAAYRGVLQAEREKAVPTLIALLKDPDQRLKDAALKYIRELPGSSVAAALAGRLQAVDTETQIVLIEALEARGDPAAAGAVAAAAGSAHSGVVMAAVRALGVLGGAEQVPLLARLAAVGGAVGRTARDSLVRLQGPGVNSALIQLGTSNEAELRATVFRVLKEVAGPNDFPDLIGLLVTVEDRRERALLQQAAIMAARRIEDRGAAAGIVVDALREADKPLTLTLVGILPRLGGATALGALRPYLKAADPTIRQVAVMTLVDWQAAEAVPELLRVAETEPSPQLRSLAFRGAVFRLRLLKDRPSAEARALVERAWAAARSPLEKASIIKTLADVPAVWSLEFVKQHRGDPALGGDAEAAYQKIWAVLNKLVLVEARGVLRAKEATIHGSGAAYEPGEDRDCIGVWNSAEAWVSWRVLILEPGTFAVEVSQSMADGGGSTYAVSVGDARVTGTVKRTGDWARFETVKLGTVAVKEPGTYTVGVYVVKKAGAYVMNLRGVLLTRVE
jgi:HEAT repeat protein